MLALYPIFNFKGFKYNPDLLQLVTMPLLVLAYLDAFEKRSFRSGAWLGLAGALALMTKYWALTMIGAVGLAALIHPARLQFLRSPAPWVAIVSLVVAMLPHLVWLQQVNFAPLTYAGESYAITDRGTINALALGYVGHNLALLALPVLLASLALAWPPRRWWLFAFWSRGATAGVNFAQALNVWIIQAMLAIGPPLGAMAFMVYIKSDWGIPLFFLGPLALLAIPRLRLRRIALLNLAASWLVISLIVLAAAPSIVAREVRAQRNEGVYRARSELARELTELWRMRFPQRWPVIAAYGDTNQIMTFYSPDHPAPLTPDEPWSSGLTSLEEAKRSGFIGVCETGDWKQEKCEAWMKAHAANGERLVATTRRFISGVAGPASVWSVVIVPPAKYPEHKEIGDKHGSRPLRKNSARHRLDARHRARDRHRACANGRGGDRQRTRQGGGWRGRGKSPAGCAVGQGARRRVRSRRCGGLRRAGEAIPRRRYPRQQSRDLRAEGILRHRGRGLDQDVRSQRHERGPADAALFEADAG
jgi:uncharacterized membrane protein (UPF0136 family)